MVGLLFIPDWDVKGYERLGLDKLGVLVCLMGMAFFPWFGGLEIKP